jgi:Mrp family chromosome partitioning ATPase
LNALERVMAEPPRGRRPSDVESRPTAPRQVAKQPITPRIVDELLGESEPTRASPEPRHAPEPRRTIPYAKIALDERRGMGGPTDPVMPAVDGHDGDADADADDEPPPLPRPAGATAAYGTVSSAGVGKAAHTIESPTVAVPRVDPRAEPTRVSRSSEPTRVSPAVATPPPERSAPSQRSGSPERSLPPDAERTRVWIATHKIPVDPDPRLVLVHDPDGARAASYRVLRHRLAERGDPRVIAVTSPGEREGKTTCAVNLALALGECGRARVLLIEANLRAPSLAALFGFMPPECFSQQLTRHREAPQDPWSVVEVGSPSLHVAAVKPGDDTSGRPLLDGVAFGIASDMLRRAAYDYIVIDTPPVLGSADVNLVEDYADGVLLVARARATTARSLRRAVEQLAPGRILGVTLVDA